MRRALLLLLALAGPVAADNAPHREGEYGGITPGQKPEKPKKAPKKGTLSWIGFEAKDGGAQIFFQSVAPFEVSQHVEGSTVVAHLTLKRLGHNTWRQVDTRFFDNPLSGIVARAVRATRGTKSRPARPAGISVRIKFKNPKDAKEGTVRTATEADGMSYVYLSFPEGADPGTSGSTGTTGPVVDPEQ
jgi:hypothetical protein